MKTVSISSLLWISCILLFTTSCSKKEDTVDPTPTGQFGLGFSGEENVKKVPASTNFGFGNGKLPSAVDLTNLFPPVGDQGQYGTCVSWAVGYNLKTALNGLTKKLNSSQLASPANQFSPRDLFTSIPDAEKGQDCGGTNFSSALDLVKNRGIATMQTVPYTNLGNCSTSLANSNWANEAKNNKFKYWRKIEGTVTSVKENIANNIPVVFGAKLADNFMSWNSDNVLSSSSSFNQVGQHAYHALIVAGYDDNKGPNGAFRVINSWGTTWGSKGYIWIDYNYFIKEFCLDSDNEHPLFIAADEEGKTNPDPNPNPNTSGVDLAPWVFSDFSSYFTSGDPSERKINFNIYNIGNQTAGASAGWSIYYIYFNAYDANDYGVIFNDDFNTSVPQNTFQCNNGNNCVFNYNMPSGTNFSSIVFGKSNITRTYNMPNITGDYYLVMIADAGDVFQEKNEQNNLFYTTIDPKYFQGGYGTTPSAEGSGKAPVFQFSNAVQIKPTLLQQSAFNSAVTENFKNAYTSEEVINLLKVEKRNGRLQKKIQENVNTRTRPSYQ